MAASPPDSVDLGHLLDLLRDDNLDSAIDAGLMACDPDTIANECDRALLTDAQQGLQGAWAARERYQARSDRLARRAVEREARRRGSVSGKQATASTLPPAAAAALARALAKASRKP